MDKNYLLHKYLNGEATSEDLQLLKGDPGFESLMKIAEASMEYEVPGYQAETNREKIANRISTLSKVRSLNPWKTILRIAAVVAVVALSYVFLTNSTTEIVTDIAQKETLLLPDNSEVIINADSELAFNKKDWKNNRAVNLQGEAYFKVAKGKKFDVNTSQGVVSVLGTQFNVFSRGQQFYVKCFEGLVSVTFADTLVKVPAGNYLKVENDRLSSFENITDLSPSWISFESSFQNTTLERVLEELQRQYPIEVVSKVNIDTRFTGSFTHNDLNVALRSICEPLQLEFNIIDNQVTLYARNNP